MKKSQLFALLMLLSTGYVAQASDDTEPMMSTMDASEEQASPSKQPANPRPGAKYKGGQGGQDGQKNQGSLNGQKRKRPKKSDDQQNQGPQGRRRGGQQRPAMMSQADIEKALGESLSYEALQSFAESIAPKIGALSASSSAQDIQAVMKQNMILNQGLMLLNKQNKAKAPDATSKPGASDQDFQDKKRGPNARPRLSPGPVVKAPASTQPAE